MDLSSMLGFWVKTLVCSDLATVTRCAVALLGALSLSSGTGGRFVAMGSGGHVLLPGSFFMSFSFFFFDLFSLVWCSFNLLCLKVTSLPWIVLPCILIVAFI